MIQFFFIKQKNIIVDFLTFFVEKSPIINDANLFFNCDFYVYSSSFGVNKTLKYKILILWQMEEK
jgi:hypothetical protein